MNSSKSEFSEEKEEDAIAKKLTEIILIESIKLNAQEVKIIIHLKEDISEVFFIVEGEVQKIPPPPKVHLHKIIKYLRALSNLDPNMKYESESGILSYQFTNCQRYEWNATFKLSVVDFEFLNFSVSYAALLHYPNNYRAYAICPYKYI